MHSFPKRKESDPSRTAIPRTSGSETVADWDLIGIPPRHSFNHSHSSFAPHSLLMLGMEM